MQKLRFGTLICLLLLCMVFISGCGKEHFEGKWIGFAKDTFSGGKDIVTFEIKKNGEGYIINSVIYNEPLILTDPNLRVGGKILKKWDIKNDLSHKGGTAKDNIINIGDGRSATYDENEKKLYVPRNNFYGDLTLERDDGKKLEEMKKQIVADTQNKLQKKYPGITYQLTE